MTYYIYTICIHLYMTILIINKQPTENFPSLRPVYAVDCSSTTLIIIIIVTKYSAESLPQRKGGTDLRMCVTQSSWRGRRGME